MEIESVNIPKIKNLPEDMENELLLSLEPGATTIIVGANGSGKTRLAVYLEKELGEKAHRISAHRALTLNPLVEKIDENKARRKLYIGNNSDDLNYNTRGCYRWNNKAETILLNDFDSLLQVLFAEQNNRALETHKAVRNGKLTEPPEATLFEKLQETWEKLLPHRKLHITGDNIQVSIVDMEDSFYSASEMSDGERAVFYILGQVLSVKQGSVLIFDEPELHIHKAIIANLWDEIEKLRSDCAFVLITHDIEFASTRSAKKYVIKNYLPDPAWDIFEVPNSDFSEEVVSLILGSRKPILFVEGGKSSLDIEVYRCCYPEWTIIPRGSCKDVIHAVSSLKRLVQDNPLLNITCAGIVDLDERDDCEVSLLSKMGIKVLPVSEIENIFLLKEVVEVILEMGDYSGAELTMKMKEFVEKIISFAEENLSGSNLEKIIIEKITYKIDNYIKNIDLSKLKDSAEVKKSLQDKIAILIDDNDSALDKWVGDIREKIGDCLRNKDIDKLIAFYKNKGLLNQAASCLRNNRRNDFESWLCRALKNKESKLLNIVKSKLPTLELS